jgi:hypothetical protein
MGRGRAKAIQKKIARDLKYSSGGTDLERLQAELSASGASSSDDEPDDAELDEFEDDDEDDED